MSCTFHLLPDRQVTERCSQTTTKRSAVLTLSMTNCLLLRESDDLIYPGGKGKGSDSGLQSSTWCHTHKHRLTQRRLQRAEGRHVKLKGRSLFFFFFFIKLKVDLRLFRCGVGGATSSRSVLHLTQTRWLRFDSRCASTKLPPPCARSVSQGHFLPTKLLYSEQGQQSTHHFLPARQQGRDLF